MLLRGLSALKNVEFWCDVITFEKVRERGLDVTMDIRHLQTQRCQNKTHQERIFLISQSNQFMQCGYAICAAL